jgi:hypothetical protein
VASSDTRNEENEGVDLARWLEESGRRRAVPGRVVQLHQPSPITASSSAEPTPYLTRPSLVYLFALATLSYLIYYFVEVGLDIGTIPSVIVFIRGYLSP